MRIVGAAAADDVPDGGFDAEQASDSYGSTASGQDPGRALCQCLADVRVRDTHSVVRGESDLEAAAEGGADQYGNDRDGKRRERLELFAHLHHMPVGVVVRGRNSGLDGAPGRPRWC